MSHYNYPIYHPCTWGVWSPGNRDLQQGKKNPVVEQNPALKADIPEGSGKLHNADEPDLETQIGS